MANEKSTLYSTTFSGNDIILPGNSLIVSVFTYTVSNDCIGQMTIAYNILKIPNTPSNFVLTDITASSTTLQWDIEKNALFYVITSQDKFDYAFVFDKKINTSLYGYPRQDFDLITIVIPPPLSTDTFCQGTILGLENNSSYQFQICSVGSCGSSDFTKRINVNTLVKYSGYDTLNISDTFGFSGYLMYFDSSSKSVFAGFVTTGNSYIPSLYAVNNRPIAVPFASNHMLQSIYIEPAKSQITLTDNGGNRIKLYASFDPQTNSSDEYPIPEYFLTSYRCFTGVVTPISTASSGNFSQTIDSDRGFVGYIYNEGVGVTGFIKGNGEVITVLLNQITSSQKYFGSDYCLSELTVYRSQTLVTTEMTITSVSGKIPAQTIIINSSSNTGAHQKKLTFKPITKLTYLTSITCLVLSGGGTDMMISSASYSRLICINNDQ